MVQHLCTQFKKIWYTKSTIISFCNNNCAVCICLRLVIGRSLPAKLNIDFISEALVCPCHCGYLQGYLVYILHFGLSVSHELQYQLKHITCILLLLFVSGQDHWLLDWVLRHTHVPVGDYSLLLLGVVFNDQP